MEDKFPRAHKNKSLALDKVVFKATVRAPEGLNWRGQPHSGFCPPTHRPRAVHKLSLGS